MISVRNLEKGPSKHFVIERLPFILLFSKEGRLYSSTQIHTDDDDRLHRRRVFLDTHYSTRLI